ncbi:MAG: type II toxin-antitoxin system VapC family toxin [Paraglaciecola sp.]|nr:type II toxin-antitoxin system VapC family toxin [Paraglaciecola sp.]
MIILDTNVISELMKNDPNPAVKVWIGKQKSSNIAITVIAIAEIQKGIMRLPKGKRQTSLIKSFKSFMADAFSGRILPFDERSAYLYGNITAERVKNGFNTDAVDLMIAAVAKNCRASIATRNIKDFQGCGIKIINPWD